MIRMPNQPLKLFAGHSHTLISLIMKLLFISLFTIYSHLRRKGHPKDTLLARKIKTFI